MTDTDDRPVLLLDADGNLFPSEEPAFEASVDVTNRFLASLGVETRYTAEQLLSETTGKNFRSTARDLAAANGVPMEPVPGAGALAPDDAPGDVLVSQHVLDDWVAEEKEVVGAYLGQVLQADPAVLGPLRRLATHYRFAVVSSSALSRLDSCFRATGMADLFPVPLRFSAEDSLPAPASKPDPAVYRCAIEHLDVRPDQAVAIEDSVPGVQSAVAAGIPTIGNLTFVPPAGRPTRRTELLAAGATRIVESWEELAEHLLGSDPT